MNGQAFVKNPKLADLFGLAGKEIVWGRLAVFGAALALAQMVSTIISLFAYSIPSEYRIWNLGAIIRVPVVYLIAAFAGYRFFRRDWQSAVVAGFVGLVLFNLFAWVMFPSFHWTFGRLWTWLATFLAFFGMSVALRIFHSMLLALFLGLVFSDLLFTVVNQAVFLSTVKDSVFLVTGQLSEFVGSTIYNGFAALGFWGGLRLSFCRPQTLGIETSISPMPAATEDRRLQALDFLSLKDRLKRSGIGSLFFAPIAIVLGLLTMNQIHVNGLLVVLGVVLLVEGIWILAKPSPSGLIVDGIVLIFLGFWNLVISIVNISAGSGGSPGFFLSMGVFQIIAGIRSIREHRRFGSLAVGGAVDSGDLAAARLWIEEAKASDPEKTPDIVDMKIRTAFSEIRWRGKLLKEHVVFLAKKTPEVCLRKDVEIQEKGEASPGGPLKIVLKFDKRSLKARIEKTHLDRLRRWKSA